VARTETHHQVHPGRDALDGQHGRLLWDVEAGGVVAGGLDVVDDDGGGRVSRVWSVGGQRSVRS